LDASLHIACENSPELLSKTPLCTSYILTEFLPYLPAPFCCFYELPPKENKDKTHFFHILTNQQKGGKFKTSYKQQPSHICILKSQINSYLKFKIKAESLGRVCSSVV
jgi:hypothetical protein